MGQHYIRQWSHLICGHGTHTGLTKAQGNNGRR